MAIVRPFDDRSPGNPTTQPVAPAQPAAAAPLPPPQDYSAALTGAYKQYLGRDPGAGEVDRWWGMGGANPTVAQRTTDLQHTTEAQNYATAHPATSPTSGGGSPQAFIQQWQQTHPANQGIGPLADALKAAGYTNVSRFMYGTVPSNNELSIDGQKFKVIGGEDSGNPSWYTAGTNDGGGGNVFSDPATSGWESLLRQVSGQLSQPQQTPDYNNLVSYLQSYMKQLQQPGYSPAEAEQIQTQSIDPMTHERDNAIQRTIQQYAAKGFRPTDGPVQQAVADVNKQYEQMRTTTHANFATQAAGLTRQNAATAAQVGQGLQTLEQGQQTGNENRALQAVNMMFQIPTMADSRLAAANTTLAGTNTGANTALQTMLQLRQQNQQQGQWNAQQEQAFWSQIGNLLTKL